jgi:Putative Flp pilus-assembly TadE/G-like
MYMLADIDKTKRTGLPVRRHRRTTVESTATRRRRRLQRGQGMIIFALSATVLIGLAGLALDTMRVYDLYAREQRAAEAGALAGDLYMPNYYTTNYTSGGTTYSAVSRALLEVSKDGFSAASNGDCNNVGVADGVYVCRVSADKNGLQVIVTQHIDVFLLATVGVQGFDVSAKATATYLVPFSLGTQNPNDVSSQYWSDGGECNAQPQNCKSHTPPHHFVAFINGPAELKEQGDPYVYCQEGDSHSSTPDPSATTNSVADSYGWQTNFPEVSPPACGSGNVDQQTSGVGYYIPNDPNGSTGHAYNFGITVNPGVKVSLYIWNPSFIPSITSGSSCTGLTELDTFYLNYNCTSTYTNFDGVVQPSNGLMDDPRLYFNVGYSLYSMNTPYAQAASPTAKFLATPYDGMPADVSAHGCKNGYLWQPNSTTTTNDGNCVSAASANQNSYIQLGGVLGGRTEMTYRLTVASFPWDNEASCTSSPQGTCGWGFHSFGLRICPQNTPLSQVIGCSLPPLSNGQAQATLNPWGNFAISFDFQANNSVQVIPIGDIGSTFAGRTVTVSVFSPGKSYFGNPGDMYFAVVPPVKSDAGQTNPLYTPTFPALLSGSGPGGPYVTTQSCPTSSQYCPPTGSPWWIHASTAPSSNSLPSSNDFNGLWINISFQLPAGYLGGQWWFTAFNGQGNGFDHMTIGLAINGGSPVHLVN